MISSQYLNMFFICGLQAGQFSTETANLKEPCC